MAMNTLDTVTIVGFGIGVAGVIAILILIVRIPDPSAAQFNVFRTVIALGGAGFALALTGFLTVDLSVSGG